MEPCIIGVGKIGDECGHHTAEQECADAAAPVGFLCQAIAHAEQQQRGQQDYVAVQSQGSCTPGSSRNIDQQRTCRKQCGFFRRKTQLSMHGQVAQHGRRDQHQKLYCLLQPIQNCQEDRLPFCPLRIAEKL